MPPFPSTDPTTAYAPRDAGGSLPATVFLTTVDAATAVDMT